jgi:uncharacterized membrane protein
LPCISVDAQLIQASSIQFLGEKKRKKTRQNRAQIWTVVSELNSKTAQKLLAKAQGKGILGREAEASRLQGHLCMLFCLLLLAWLALCW